MKGERIIETKVDGNKITHTYEFRNFEGDFEGVASDVNDYITDDPEDMHIFGLYLGFDDFYSMDCDMVIEKIEEKIKEEKEMYGEKESTESWENHIKLLETAKGFTIYFSKTDEHYKSRIWKNKEEE